MRLYTLTGATALDDPQYGSYTADEQGAFDFPNELSDRLHRFHFGGKPVWEDDIERQERLLNEELERRQDPATLLSAVERLEAAAKAMAPQETSPPSGDDGGDGTAEEPDGPGDGDQGDAKEPAKKTSAKKTASKTAK
ncbi:hypothetical protein [Streptomyces sp. NPDC051554]|uniref:hypothetical protein n=1 Tax=Streptomyces sp. NPDC051554 TaxID=3365656 RepID=UPI0037ACD1D5